MNIRAHLLYSQAGPSGLNGDIALSIVGLDESSFLPRAQEGGDAGYWVRATKLKGSINEADSIPCAPTASQIPPCR
jgi:hypothetical protein